jgi:hypothetical protein
MGIVAATNHRIWMTEARGLDGVAEQSVDLVVTSPPYPMIQMWDTLFEAADPLIGEALAQSNGAIAFERMHLCLDPGVAGPLSGAQAGRDRLCQYR